MTIGGWILFSIVTFCFFTVYWFIWTEAMENSTRILWGSVFGAILVLVLIGLLFYYNCTESGHRAMKSQSIDFNNGINREVKVYDMNGELVEEYKGKFDYETNEDRTVIVFDDENGKRHEIFFPTGTVSINEIGEENGT